MARLVEVLACPKCRKAPTKTKEGDLTRFECCDRIAEAVLEEEAARYWNIQALSAAPRPSYLQPTRYDEVETPPTPEVAPQGIVVRQEPDDPFALEDDDLLDEDEEMRDYSPLEDDE